MNALLKHMALAAAVALSASTAALAQTSSPSPTMEPAATATPAATDAPSAPKTMAPNPAASQKHHGTVKKLQSATLPFSEISYGITHPVQELNALRKMKKVDFSNVRIVRVSPLMKARLKLHADAAAQTLAFDSMFRVQDAMLAQTNGSNSPIANLQNVLANINVSNALNNVLNGSNVGVNVSLADVLNGNKIGISQVLGVYVHGFSIINTIIK